MTKTLSEKKRDLIEVHRPVALKIARSLLRRWNLFLELGEVQSLSDMALCEAARTFDPERGSRFVTYLFPFIKGSLINEIKRMKRDRSESCERSSFANNDGSDAYQTPECEQLVDPSPSPEELRYSQEVRAMALKALEALQPLERDAVIAIDIHGHKVAQYARKIGYSRPYLSSVRSRAISKLQPYFSRLAA
jgi:RNA polymerase sigma factor (sigma-70 family)